MYSMVPDNSDSIRSTKFQKLTEAICGLVRGRNGLPPAQVDLGCDCGSVQIEDYSMVRFLPFDCTDEEGVNVVLQHIDFSIQYGEDLDFKEPKVKTSSGSARARPAGGAVSACLCLSVLATSEGVARAAHHRTSCHLLLFPPGVTSEPFVLFSAGSGRRRHEPKL